MLKNLIPGRFRKSEPLVAVVRTIGVIGMVTPLRPGLALASLNPILEQAFKMRAAKAVVLAVNSPGGSPVQSALIQGRIRQLAAKHDKPVYAFVEDVAASGGYMLACAADEIYADASSIVGSIGVISASFGFTNAMKKLGIERRVHTSGEHKMTLDSFQPEKPDDVKRLKRLQREVHEGFIALVKERRGGKLNGSDKKLFSGEFWSGPTAMKLGLIDGIGDMHTVMRDKLGENVRFKILTPDRGWLRRRFGGSVLSGARLADLTGAHLADDLISAVETRALWQRFGL